MRLAARLLALSVVLAAAAPPLRAQAAPPHFASMTTSRVLLLPAQEVAGAPDGRNWMARFDSVLTARLEDGGIGTQWAYPRDAVRFARMNPSYVSDPHLMGAQPLKNVQMMKNGFSLPEPFASRLRALIAVADARDAIVPVAARIDSTKTPGVAQMQIMIVDAKASTVKWSGIIETHFAGGPRVAADSLALMVARLFVQ